MIRREIFRDIVYGSLGPQSEFRDGHGAETNFRRTFFGESDDDVAFAAIEEADRVRV